MPPAEQIATALRDHVPPTLQAEVDALAEVLEAVAAQRMTAEEAQIQLGTNRVLTPLLQALAGREIATASALLSFGTENSLGDVTIRDVAGGNIVHLTVNQYYTAEDAKTNQRSLRMIPAWAIALSVAALLLSLGLVYWAFGPNLAPVTQAPTAVFTAVPTATDGPTVGPPPAFDTRFSFDSSSTTLTQLVAEPSYRPTLPITDTLTIVGIDVGTVGTGEQRLAWNVRVRMTNTSDKPWQLELRPGFFTFSDNLGRSAPLMYWCCPSSPTELLLPGESRDIQLIFESVEGWYGKTRGINELNLRVQGLLPIVRANWSIPPLLTAD